MLGGGEDIPPQEPSLRPPHAPHPKEGALLGTDQQRADRAVPSGLRRPTPGSRSPRGSELAAGRPSFLGCPGYFGSIGSRLRRRATLPWLSSAKWESPQLCPQARWTVRLVPAGVALPPGESLHVPAAHEQLPTWGALHGRGWKLPGPPSTWSGMHCSQEDGLRVVK